MPACNQTELLGVLKPLESNANYAGCSTSHRLCADAACKALIAPMAALHLPNCSITKGSGMHNPIVLNRLNIAQCDPHTLDPNKIFLFRVFSDVLNLLKQH